MGLGGPEQVDQRVVQLEHRGVVVLEVHRQAEDILVERLRPLQILGEQGDGIDDRSGQQRTQVAPLSLVSPAWTARPPGTHRRDAGAYPASAGSGGPEILEAKSQGFVSETRPRSARRTYDQRLRLHGDRSGRERGAAAGV